MLGRFKKKYITNIGKKNKSVFLENLPIILKSIPKKYVDFDVVSMSGKNYFEDQLFSLLSFYYNVGIPSSWVIYNDGTYSENEISLILQIENTSVKDIEVIKYKRETEKYPTLKKMFLLNNIVPKRKTIFTDSDVLFFPSFLNKINKFENNNCYIVDEKNEYFDSFISDKIDVSKPLNLGFLLLNSIPNWNIVWDYIEERIKDNKFHYWTDQTATHIMAQNEKFIALPKNEFVVGGNDSFKIRNSYNYSTIALRHFVGPIRHKMWQHSYSKIFNFQ